jgi:hypothetical protein
MPSDPSVGAAAEDCDIGKHPSTKPTFDVFRNLSVRHDRADGRRRMARGSGAREEKVPELPAPTNRGAIRVATGLRGIHGDEQDSIP